MYVQPLLSQNQPLLTAPPPIQASLCTRIKAIFTKVWQWLVSCFTTTAPKPSFSKDQPTPPVIVQQPQLAMTEQSPTASEFLAFYRGTATNPQERTLNDILTFNDTQLEETHDYIQWLFINKAPSNFNGTAPILNTEIIQAFKEDKTLQTNLIRSFERMLTFYGLTWQENSKTIVRAKNFEDRAKVWLNQNDHNFLRITRILLCLNTLGESERATAFYTILRNVADTNGLSIINEKSLKYWQTAAGVVE